MDYPELQAHQSTHIPCHYAHLLSTQSSHPGPDVSKSKRVSIGEIVGQAGDGGEDISVRSMLPEEVPVGEVWRREVMGGRGRAGLEFSRKA